MTKAPNPVTFPNVGLLNDRFILIDFDAPNAPGLSSFGSDAPLAMEYFPAPGDSGGGIFIDDGGTKKLAAVISIRDSGPVGPNKTPDGSVNSDYSDVAASIRVNQFNNWIDDQISARYWKAAADGTFASGANWEEGTAPGPTNLAVFDKTGAYTVNTASDLNTKRIQVRRGDVTLDLSGHNLTLTNTPIDSSIIVGQRQGDNTKLTITNGTVNAVDVSVERNSSIGNLKVDPGASLRVSGP